MRHNIFIFPLLALFCVNAASQQRALRSGSQQYSDYAYIDVIETYEKLASKGYRSQDVIKKLADSYYFNANYDKAADWYRELFEISDPAEAEYYYRYGQCLKSCGDYANADKFFAEFRLRSKNAQGAKNLKNDPDYMDKIKSNSGRYRIEDAGINSRYSDYGAFMHKNRIYFASSRDTGSLSKRRDRWTGGYFSDIYYADIDPSTGAAQKAHSFRPGFNTKFHESTPVFTRDGKTAYFTRNNYAEGKKRSDEHKVMRLKVYRAQLGKGDKWHVSELPFNSDSYSTAHPALSPDGKTLYFASDMPGSFGESDLYRVAIKANGGYGSPENLGPSVNTVGRETFPFISSDNRIYFSSDGHSGLGGLDVFAGRIDGSGNVAGIENLGMDINSAKDDFAYSIDPSSGMGYFSSNRDGGSGSDDIYRFSEYRKLQQAIAFKGAITDADTGAGVPGVRVTLLDSQMGFVNSAVSDSLGNYSFEAESGRVRYVKAEKDGYQTKEHQAVPKPYDASGFSFAMERSSCIIAVGDNLGKCFGIRTLYFDLDSSSLTAEGILDLQKILAVLSDHPGLRLEIRSHTDSRGSRQYNLRLSEQRSRSVMRWLVNNGISAERLKGRGYGENQPVNGCSDGVKCTEQEHQANRRTEFIVTDL